jgi:diketogulonate reductase-like aldo/keto reductase
LTSLSGRAPAEKTVNLREALKHLSKSTGLTESQLILRWAFDRTNGVVVTSTSKMQRAQDAMDVLTGKQLEEDDLRTIEEAALKDGYEGQRVSCPVGFILIKTTAKGEMISSR